eukprot:7801536-Pyramimonas_sp.AAC.1
MGTLIAEREAVAAAWRARVWPPRVPRVSRAPKVTLALLRVTLTCSRFRGLAEAIQSSVGFRQTFSRKGGPAFLNRLAGKWTQLLEH